MKNDYVLPIVILSLICLVMSGALAVMNDITWPIITQAASERAYQAQLEIIPDAEAFVPLDTAALPSTVSVAYGTSNEVGYIFFVSSNGYGGEMEIICGITPDGKIIKSAVLSHSETQGLGTAVFERAPEYEGKAGGETENVDAVAGSTITSNAYRCAMNDALAAYETVKGAR